MRILLVLLLTACSGQKDMERSVVWEKIELEHLPGFHDDHVHEALPALHASCKVLPSSVSYTGHDNQQCEIHKKDWDGLCNGLKTVKHKEEVKALLKEHTVAYKVREKDSDSGVFTGYYEPLLFGSLKKHGKYQTPLYMLPLKNKHIPRSKIVKGALSGRKLELVWVNSPVDAFFLQIQGSGRVILDNGQTMRLGYAGENGYPYVSIGKVMIDRNIIPREN